MRPPSGGPAQPAYDSSNTNVLAFAGRILSLTEGCYPYELSAELDTLRRLDPGHPLPHGMTAHPKVDPVTGELHAFSYWWDAPELIYHRFDPTGQLVATEPIRLPAPVSMHDFAITAAHILFFDQPAVFDLDALATGLPLRLAPRERGPHRRAAPPRHRRRRALVRDPHLLHVPPHQRL